ncbi:MAG: hypothetical protein MUC79_08920 [Thiobacillaceae bacterium]|jgi:hypothetical protein|nr:hypothetical protein [Thiobacillaceae bacterium]
MLIRRLFVIVAAIALLPLGAQGAAFTDYLENKILDDLLRTTAYSPPATHYVGLMTSACSDSAAGTEVSGGSYARVAVSKADASYKGSHGSATGASSGTNGTASNAAAVTFPAPTANWGSVTHWGIWDAASSGNLLVCSALTVAKTINNGDAAPSFAIDALTVQVDN